MQDIKLVILLAVLEGSQQGVFVVDTILNGHIVSINGIQNTIIAVQL